MLLPQVYTEPMQVAYAIVSIYTPVFCHYVTLQLQSSGLYMPLCHCVEFIRHSFPQVAGILRNNGD